MGKKQDNDKDMEKKKFDKFAIWSFVISLIFYIALSLISFYSKPLSNAYESSRSFAVLVRYAFGIVPISIPLSIIFGIVSLTRISKNRSLKGYLFAILGILIAISSVCTILFLIINQPGGW